MEPDQYVTWCELFVVGLALLVLLTATITVVALLISFIKELCKA